MDDTAGLSSDGDGDGEGDIDFALAAYREDGRWQVELLPPRVAAELDVLVTTLRQRPGDGGALGLVSVDEDFFVAVRVRGDDLRLLLSDVTAATDWPLARSVLDRLGLPLPDGEEEEQVQPAGDLGIFADLGVDAMAMGALCDDLDRYPDESLADVAARLGFGAEYELALDATAS